MSYTIVSAKIDPQMKKEAMATANMLGIPLSLVIKKFLKEFIRTKTVTFTNQGEEPSEYLKKAIIQAEKDYKVGRTSPAFRTGEEAVAWLEKHGI